MKLKLSYLVRRKINEAKSPNDEWFNSMMADIKDMSRLYDIEGLSNEELKELVRKYYNVSIYVSDDTRRISKRILKTDSINYTSIKTNIANITDWGSNKYGQLNIWIYYPTSLDLDLSKVYTTQEIKELVNNKKIVLEDFDYELKEEPAPSDLEIIEEEPFLPIAYVYEGNYGDYEDIVLSMIRKQLPKERIERDILRIINIMRTKLRDYNKKLGKQKSKLDSEMTLLNSELATNNAKQIRNSEYKEMLNQFSSRVRKKQK